VDIVNELIDALRVLAAVFVPSRPGGTSGGENSPSLYVNSGSVGCWAENAGEKRVWAFPYSRCVGGQGEMARFAVWVGVAYVAVGAGITATAESWPPGLRK
jgi:hypothetical protein